MHILREDPVQQNSSPFSRPAPLRLCAGHPHSRQAAESLPSTPRLPLLDKTDDALPASKPVPAVAEASAGTVANPASAAAPRSHTHHAKHSVLEAGTSQVSTPPTEAATLQHSTARSSAAVKHDVKVSDKAGQPSSASASAKSAPAASASWTGAVKAVVDRLQHGKTPALAASQGDKPSTAAESLSPAAAVASVAPYRESAAESQSDSAAPTQQAPVALPVIPASASSSSSSAPVTPASAAASSPLAVTDKAALDVATGITRPAQLRPASPAVNGRAAQQGHATEVKNPPKPVRIVR